FEVTGCVLGPREPGEQGLVEGVEAARRLAGGYLALDGPEHLLGRGQEVGDAAVASFVRELGIGLRATGLWAVVNLNGPSPPSWADDLAEGPLFAGRRDLTKPEQLQAIAQRLREQLARADL